MPYEAEKLVIGCGNVLFKDDGFGYYVIKAIDEYFSATSSSVSCLLKSSNVFFINFP